MKKFLIPIFLFSSLATSAQMRAFTEVRANGQRMGGLEHLAPTNAYGYKDPWIIWLSGTETRKVPPISTGDTTRLSIIMGKGLPKLVANAPLPYQHVPGGAATDLRRWNVMAPQCSSSDGQYPADLVTICLNRIATYASTTDTSLIVLMGYSLGGGGVFSLLRYSAIKAKIKYAVAISGGYINTPDYVGLAASGINIDVFATEGDQLASVTLSDNWVNGIKAQNPMVVPNYIRLPDISPTNSPTDHNKMCQIIAEDTTAGDSYLMTNGSTWTRPETPYTRALRFFGPTRKHSVFPFLILPLFIQRKRKYTTSYEHRTQSI